MINCVKRFAALLLAAVLLLPLVPIHGEATFEGDDKIVVVLDPGHGGYGPGQCKFVPGTGEELVSEYLQILDTLHTAQ